MLLQHLMLRMTVVCALLAALLTGYVRVASPKETNQFVGGDGVPIGTPSNPPMVGTMPFTRSGDPVILPAGTTAQQYQITQPPETTSYRFVNPCGVDVRIRTVLSMSASVTATTDTRFLARTSEMVASMLPLTNPRIVSIMATVDGRQLSG